MKIRDEKWVYHFIWGRPGSIIRIKSGDAINVWINIEVQLSWTEFFQKSSYRHSSFVISVRVPQHLGVVSCVSKLNQIYILFRFRWTLIPVREHIHSRYSYPNVFSVSSVAGRAYEKRKQINSSSALHFMDPKAFYSPLFTCLHSSHTQRSRSPVS